MDTYMATPPFSHSRLRDLDVACAMSHRMGRASGLSTDDVATTRCSGGIMPATAAACCRCLFTRHRLNSECSTVFCTSLDCNVPAAAAALPLVSLPPAPPPREPPDAGPPSPAPSRKYDAMDARGPGSVRTARP